MSPTQPSPQRSARMMGSPRTATSAHFPQTPTKMSPQERKRLSAHGGTPLTGKASISVRNSIWKTPLPETPTILLTNLYETLIMARNCEIPVAEFWARYDTTKPASYTIGDIEQTLSTVGVECNTQTDGKHISTGRWLLLRHGHFLLRAQQSIVWIDRTQAKDTAASGEADLPPVVWDWKSKTESWRWKAWLEQVQQVQ